MRCNNGARQYGPIPVWSKRDDTTWLFFPITEPMDSTDIKMVRASFALDSSTGSVEIRPALRISNDGITWDTPTVIGNPTPRSADGTTWGTAFVNVSSTTQTKALVQFGIQAKNTTGTTTQDNGMASMKLDVTGA